MVPGTLLDLGAESSTSSRPSGLEISAHKICHNLNLVFSLFIISSKINFYIWELRYGGLLRVILVSLSSRFPSGWASVPGSLE